MRRRAILIVPLVAALAIAGVVLASRRGAEDLKPSDGREQAREATSSAETTPSLPEGDTALLEKLDVEEVLKAEAAYAEAGVEVSGGEPMAGATIELTGEPPKESRVFALLSSLADSSPESPKASVVLWVPGEPDARFIQYVWDRKTERVERFEASIPAEEFAFYVPTGEKAADRPAEGFEAGRTGLIEGVDVARLASFGRGESAAWSSDTP